MRWVGNSFMEMLAEFERTTEKFPSREKAIQAKGTAWTKAHV